MNRLRTLLSFTTVGTFTSLAVSLTALSLLAPEEADAIPAFARRHKISCTTCHAPFPKLKAYGDEYAGNGFVIPEDEKERDYVSAGDNLLWLNRDFPVAVRFDAYGVYEDDHEVDNDLRTPWGVKILSGGTVYKNIGYYFYFYFSERGEVAGIEDAYVHFNDVFGSTLDIMVGQFQTSDPLMKRELRLTYEDYEIYKTEVGLAQANLAYDRGVMLPFSIERSKTDVVMMVVNGNGLAEAGRDGRFDKDKYKNFGFRVNQAVEERLSLGGFAYYGKEQRGRVWEEILYLGPDANLVLGPVELTGQYLYRRDTNPYFFPFGPYSDREVETNGIIAEIVYSPQLDRSRHYFTLLYNMVDSDIDNLDYQTATISGTYLLARNLRLVGEYTRDIEAENNRVVVGFTTAF